MNENNILVDLQADLDELTSLYEKATRTHVRTLMEKEITKLKDIILIVKKKFFFFKHK